MESEAAPHRANAAHPTPPSLTTDRLVLRPLRGDDVDALLDLYSRPEVMQWIGDGRVLSARAEAQTLLERRRALRLPDPLGVWGLELDGRLVGMLLLKPIPDSGSPAAADPRAPELIDLDGDIEIGWHLHPDVWGRGVATEAALRVLDHARQHGLTRVVAVTHPDNLPSQRVCTRLGMTHRGPTDRYYDVTTELFDLEMTR